VQAIAALRCVRLTGAQIAEALSMPSVRDPTGIGLGKIPRLEPPEPANRYERRHPGELLHVDVKSSAGSRAAPGTPSAATSTPTSAAIASAT
jgi:hypothetical protein